MLSYYGHPDNVNAKSQAAGEKISALLVDSALTYEEAEIALEYAQQLLFQKTKPINLPVPVSDY